MMYMLWYTFRYAQKTVSELRQPRATARRSGYGGSLVKSDTFYIPHSTLPPSGSFQLLSRIGIQEWLRFSVYHQWCN